MKHRRKFLQMLEARVQHSLAHDSMTSTGALHRVHSIASLAADQADFKAFTPAERIAGPAAR